MTPDIPVSTEEKRIKLEPGERRRAHRIFKMEERIRNAIVDILAGSMENVMDAEECLWDEMSQRFGYQDTSAMHRDGFSLKIDWITDEVILLKKLKNKSFTVKE